MPAVSVKVISSPLMETLSLTVSRVVPGMSVTIERSKARSAFIRELFPTFGRPAITARAPLFMILA